MTPRQLRPFLWVAWLGVATTALNTGIHALPGGGLLAPWRDWILLFHAPATLLPVVGLALIGYRYSPFAAMVALIFTFVEKSTEFAGQALRLFPPEEVIAGVPAAAVVSATWDQLFFVLWCCNSAGAAAAGLLMLRLQPSRLGKVGLVAAGGASLLTLAMLLGPDYVGLPVPAPGAFLFFLVFTGYRLMIALVLGRLVCETPKEEAMD